jgi:hypothetical protein
MAEASKGAASDQEAAMTLAGGGAKSAVPTLHPGTLPTPQSGCRIIYDSGQFLRTSPSNPYGESGPNNACVAT